MSRCECSEITISTFLDGEADHTELMDLLDHLMICPDCRGFYQQARQLQDLVEGLPLAVAPAPPDSQAARGRGPLAILSRLAAPPRWAWGLAAAFLVTLILWAGDDLWQRGSRGVDAGDLVNITLGENTDTMDDTRFLELTVELLQANHRYHEAMADVLEQVHASQMPEEGSPETGRYRSETELTQGVDGDRRGEVHAEGDPERWIN